MYPLAHCQVENVGSCRYGSGLSRWCRPGGERDGRGGRKDLDYVRGYGYGLVEVYGRLPWTSLKKT